MADDAAAAPLSPHGRNGESSERNASPSTSDAPLSSGQRSAATSVPRSAIACGGHVLPRWFTRREGGAGARGARALSARGKNALQLTTRTLMRDCLGRCYPQIVHQRFEVQTPHLASVSASFLATSDPVASAVIPLAGGKGPENKPSLIEQKRACPLVTHGGTKLNE
jgi:hypothetical protein